MTSLLEKLTLEVLRACPCRCLHCSSNSEPDASDEIPLETAKSLVAQAGQLGARKIVVSGGEPLLYQHLVELVDYVHSCRMRTVIYTSGSTASQKGGAIAASRSLLESLVASGVRRFNVSLHSHLRAVNDWLMDTPGSWDNAWAFLKAATELGCHVHVHTLLMRQNCRNLLPLMRLAENAGVLAIRLLRLVNQGRAREHYHEMQLSEDDWIAVASQLERVRSMRSSSVQVRLGPHIPIDVRSGYECNLDKPKLLVEPCGSVSVCPALKGARAFVGAPTVYGVGLESIVRSQWRLSVTDLKNTYAQNGCPAEAIYQGILSHTGELLHA